MTVNAQNTSGWPKMAQAVDQAGRALRTRYGTTPIRAEEIKREAEGIGGYKRGSVIPSDYCYNLVNRAEFSFTHAVLVHVGRGLYEYVGPGYAFSGSIMWRPKRGTQRQVGIWSAGEYQITADPRGGAAV
jgi:hypothetical protein